MFWLPPLAFLLDLFFADPPRLPHPVQGVGLLADRLEAPARKLPRPVLAGGLVLAFLLLAVFCIVQLLLSLPFFLNALAAVWLAWSGLALGGLLRESKAALAAIRAAENSMARSGDPGAAALARARSSVQMLVSRDTSAMDVDDLYRSLGETISENCNDAFVAPYFWLCLGGPVALWLYKTVSTMDSMWGYQNERWRDLGKASARLDDVLVYIPARLSVLLLLCAARLRRLWAARTGDNDSPVLPDLSWSLRAMAGQARRCASPNAGWPMAAAAWLFNGRCGGLTPYDGKMVEKPLLGPAQGKWQAANIAALISLVQLAGVVCCLLSLPLLLVFN